MDFKLEVVVLPVSDVDRAKDFYKALGWRQDADFVTGAGVPGGAADPARVARVGDLRGRADHGRARLGRGAAAGGGRHRRGPGRTGRRGAEVSEVFHDEGGVFHHAGTAGRPPGRASYGRVSFATRTATWFVQEVHPAAGRVTRAGGSTRCRTGARCAGPAAAEEEIGSRLGLAG